MFEYLSGLDISEIANVLSSAAQSEISRSGFFFLLAAWIHSGRVKNEIAKNFVSLTAAINNVATTLRDDLNAQSKILANHGKRLENLEKEIKPESQGG